MTTVIVLSDTHVGSTVGLWPKSHPVEGGGTYAVSKYQAWLLKCWQDMIEQVARMDEKPILVVNGDAVQGVNNRDGQLITNKTDIQASAAEALFRPLVERCSALYMVRGTEWHEGKGSEHVEQLAKALGAVPHHTTGQYTRWDLFLELGDVVAHFAHHIQSSSVPWYESTVPARDALMFLAELRRFYGNKAPNVELVVRSHRHRYVQVHLPPSLISVVTPAWQLRTAFSYKVASAMLPEIGWLQVTKDELGVRVTPHIYPLAAIHVEKVKA